MEKRERAKDGEIFGPGERTRSETVCNIGNDIKPCEKHRTPSLEFNKKFIILSLRHGSSVNTISCHLSTNCLSMQSSEGSAAPVNLIPPKQSHRDAVLMIQKL